MAELTKRALADSLKKFMRTTPLSKITVGDIAADCGVTRQTLYYNFQDIYDLLKWTYLTEIHEVLGQNKTKTTWQVGFLDLLKYLSENKKVVMNTYHSISRDLLENHLNDVVFTLIYDVVCEFARELNVIEADKKRVAKYYKIFFVGVIVDWIKEGMTDSPEQVATTLSKIIEGDIFRSLQKYEKKSLSECDRLS